MPPNFYNAGDQAIYSAGDFFIPQERYRAAPYTVNQPTNPDEVPAGIPTVYQPQGGGGGGYVGSVNDLIKNYTLDTRNQYFNSQKTPLVDDLYQSKLDKTFMGFPSYQQQQLTGPDMGEYIASNTDVPLELTTAGKIQNTLGNIGQGITGLANKIGGFGPVSMLLGSMDKFDTLPAADQEFIKQNMGYRGPTVFGDNSSGLSKDPFGINTRSAFGNYADFVGEKSKSLGQSLQESAQKAGLSFDPETGEVTGDDDDIEAWEKQTKLKRTKQRYYFQKEQERIKNEKEMAEKAAAEAEAARLERERVGAVQGLLNEGSYVSRDSGGYSASDRAVGGGREATNAQGQNAAQATAAGTGTSQGYSQHYAGGGRVYYMDGGLADMLEIYD